MKQKIRLTFFTLCLSLVILISGCTNKNSPTAPAQSTLKSEIDKIVNQHLRVGALVGLINKQGEKLVFKYGKIANNDSRQPDEKTVFEIGSITKTFTCILIADMFLKGSFIDDTISHYLPYEKVTMPSIDGVEIRFIHLVTHTSGLPRSPHDSDYPYPPGYDKSNPYAAYTTEHVYDYLKNYCVLDFTPGTKWQYSNIGMGLVGHIVGIMDGTSYETILKREILMN